MRFMKPLLSACALVAALGLVQPALSAEKMTGFSTLAVPYVTINPGPVSPTGCHLRIEVGNEMSFQAYHFNNGLGVGQFFPTNSTGPGDFGIFVRRQGAGGGLYAPNFASHVPGTATASLGPYTPWTPVSQSAVTGSGTPADPYTVVTVASAHTLKLTHRTTYICASDNFRHYLTFKNDSTAAKTFDVAIASDLYLGNSDNGIPFYSPPGPPQWSAGGRECPGFTNMTVCHIPFTSTIYRSSEFYANIWTKLANVGTQLPAAPPPPAGTTCVDNGCGIQWKNIILQPGSSVTLQALTAFQSKAGKVVTTVGVNKDIKNNTGSPATQIDILIAGLFTVTQTYNGYPANTFGTFTQTTTPAGNTRLKWSNPNNAVAPNAIAHVGFTGPGFTAKILGVFWSETPGGVKQPLGCAKQVQTNTHAWGTSTQGITYANLCDSCESVPLYVGQAVVEWHRNEVPLADLNPQTVRNPIRTDVIAAAPVLLSPGAEATVSIPNAPPDAKFGVVIHKVGSTSALNGPEVTTDVLQFDVAGPDVPSLSTWAAIGLGLILAAFGYLLLRRRRELTA